MKKHNLPKNLYFKGKQYIFQIQIPESIRANYSKKHIKIYLGRDLAPAKIKCDFFRSHYLAEFEDLKNGWSNQKDLARHLNSLVKNDPEDEDAYTGLLDALIESLQERDGSMTPGSDKIIRNALNPASFSLQECRIEYERSTKGSVGKKHLISVLNAFDEFISLHGENTDVSEINRRVVSDWINDHIQNLKSPRGGIASLETRKKRVKALSTIFNDLLLRGYIDSNPFSRASLLVKANSSDKSKQKKRPWTQKEIRSLFKLNGKFYRLNIVIKILCLTGLRLSELWDIRKIDIEQGEIRVHKGKTKNAVRTIPVHPILDQSVWNDFFDVRDEVKKGHMTKLMQEARKEIGVGNEVDIHSCRRYFSTQLERVGTPEHLAASILGHSKSSMSYDLYSGGPLLEQMKEYIDKVGI